MAAGVITEAKASGARMEARRLVVGATTRAGRLVDGARLVAVVREILPASGNTAMRSRHFFYFYFR